MRYGQRRLAVRESLQEDSKHAYVIHAYVIIQIAKQRAVKSQPGCSPQRF
jgi:hypothetical protein